MMGSIEDILRRSMGLEASSIGTTTVEMAIHARMVQVGTATPEDYLQRLRDEPAELDELIEAVVVPETWFFRDGMPFTSLTRWVRGEWQPAHPGETLRVLTIPCSTGEEPYTVAMALLGAGVPPQRFMVDAVDISRRAIERAKCAIYGQNSFRGKTLEFRDRYFTPISEGYALAPEVRRQVRFEIGNVLAADFWPSTGRFDVIFCRNLLIYFDRPTQTKAITALSAMLAPDGLFFVGHAETSIPPTVGFKRANYPMSFAFHKAPARITAAPSVRTSRLPTALPTPRVTFRMPGALPPPTRRVSAPLPPPIPPPAHPAGFDAARALADQGKLEEASRLCEEHLRQHGASAAAWYLLGSVRDAAGDRCRAAECYAKTLYLEPDHQEALLQRALLAEQTGDAAIAAQLRRRIARVQQRTIRP